MNFKETKRNKVILELSSDDDTIVGIWNGVEHKLLVKISGKEIYNDRMNFNIYAADFKSLMEENIKSIVSKRDSNDTV